MRTRPFPALFFACLCLSSGGVRAEGPGLQGLRAALSAGRAEEIGLTWTQGPPGAGETLRLTIKDARARLARCAGEGRCSDVGPGLVLTPGQRERLLSGLRAAGLSSLRSADTGVPTDRSLVLSCGAERAGAWSLPRGEWPVPAGGDSEGLAAFLDELVADRAHAAAARPPVPVPRTPEELSQLTLKFRLRPRTLPGGVLTIEHGVASAAPEEGSVPRAPRPAPWQHALSPAEQAQLVAVLGAAQFDRLEDAVPRRAAPAIGDDDGRLATVHLFPPLAGPLSGTEPRGYQRFLQDLLRSPARALVEQLLALLTSPPPPLLPVPKTVKEVIGRDDLILTWQGQGREATVRLADLQPEPREALRQAVVIAGPYLARKGKAGERVLVVAAPVADRAHVLGTFGGALSDWRRGPTSRLCALLEPRLGAP